MHRVLVFDSGVGGLSLLSSFKPYLGDLELVFLSDNEAFPYGNKEDDWLIGRVIGVIQKAVEAYRPDLVVVACNTASTLALDELRHRYTIPFVGVVPAIKPAATLTRTKHIAVLATPATIGRTYTQRLVDDFAQDCRVSLLAMPDLVELAEAKLLRNEAVEEAVGLALKPMAQMGNVDVVVLACTHFPLLRDEIVRYFDHFESPPQVIDSGTAVVQRVISVLDELVTDSDCQTTESNCRIAFTQPILDTRALQEYLSSYDVGCIEMLRV